MKYLIYILRAKSCTELLQLNTSYYTRIFENLIAFELLTVYPKGQLSSDMRDLDYINDIVRYMSAYRRYNIKNPELTHFNRVRNAPPLQGTEPLRKAALVFLASQELGVGNVANYEETGVSNSYLYSHVNRKRYTD